MQSTPQRRSPTKSPPTELKTSLVVFDFDCTLSARHLWKAKRMQGRWGRAVDDAIASGAFTLSGARDMDGAFVCWVFGGEARVAALAEFLGALRAAGAGIAIATNGDGEEVRTALLQAGLLGCVDAMYSRQDSLVQIFRSVRAAAAALAAPAAAPAAAPVLAAADRSAALSAARLFCAGRCCGRGKQ